MGNRGNTNLRYHIFKELRKYQESKKNDSGTINSFVISVFAGISSSLIVSWIQEGQDLSYKILSLLAFTILYPVIYQTSLFFVRKWKKYISPFLCKQTKDRDLLLSLEIIEERAAKVNYEVFYLVYLANSYVNEPSKENVAMQFNYSEAIFYLNTALRKFCEAVSSTDEKIPADKLSDSRIISIMNMMGAIFTNLQNANLSHFDKEKMDFIAKYNSIVYYLGSIYNIKLNQLDFK